MEANQRGEMHNDKREVLVTDGNSLGMGTRFALVEAMTLTPDEITVLWYLELTEKRREDKENAEDSLRHQGLIYSFAPYKISEAGEQALAETEG